LPSEKEHPMDPTLLLNSSSPSRLLCSALCLDSITSQNVHSLYDVYAFNATAERNQNITRPLATSLTLTITRKPLVVLYDLVHNVKHRRPANSIDVGNDHSISRYSPHPPPIDSTTAVPNSPYRLHPPPQGIPRCRSWCPRRD
jgi:hypothetical protein